MRRRRRGSSRSGPPESVQHSWSRSRIALGLAAAIAILLVGTAFLYGPFPFVSSQRRAPNVLLITIDTLRWDHVGCYGAKSVRTPVLDRLAARGTRFDSAIMHTPLTAPSHASILTGLTPLRHGVRDNGAFALPPSVPTLATVFKTAGYATAAFVSGFPLDRRFGFAAGFDTYDDRLPNSSRLGHPGLAGSERRGDLTTMRAISWLSARGGSTPAGDSPRPWFLWVHYFDPHAPYDPPREWGDRYATDPYDGEITFVDDQLARLLQAVETSPRGDDTVVLVTADHGESLGEHGEETHGVFIYDSTVRVPWIMAGPGVPEGRSSTVLARGIDAMPTLLDLAGVNVPVSIEGRSLAPALRRDRVDERPVYLESLLSARHFGWAELHGLRTSRWKYIDAPAAELYDLTRDSGESTNMLTAESEQAAAMSRQLDAAWRAGADAARTAPARDPDAERRLSALGYMTRTAGAARVRRDPKSSISLINRVEHAIAETHVDARRAADALRAVLAEDPGISIARSQLAAALASIGDHRGALEEIESLKTSGAAGPDDLLLASESLRALGRTPEAQAARDEAARLDPASPEPPLTEARAAMAEREPARAAAAFRRALQLAPDQPEALAGLGEIALLDGDSSQASAYFERVLAQDPANVPARTRLGMIRGREGRFQEAIPLLREAVDDAPQNAEALAGLAAALARTGAPAAAVSYFERALAAGPRTPALLNGLGFARLETGDRTGALAALRASLSLDPNQPRIVDAVRDLSGSTAGERHQP